MQRLEALAAFASKFSDKEASFGIWHPMTGEGTAENPHTFPWFELSELGNEFLKTVYETGVILREFDWATWAHGPEGQELASDRKALSEANEDQLAKLLTAIVRQDRFVEGALSSAFEAGLLLAITQRAQVLSLERAESLSGGESKI
jgi:hypothetical protein